VAVTVPFIARLQADIIRDVEEIEDRKITHWLTMLASGKPLRLDDFRGGTINFQGVGFSGSPELVYDQYISRLVEDFEERWIRVSEDAISQYFTADVDETAEQAAGLIQGYSSKLISHARETKERLGRLRNGAGAGRLRLLPRSGPDVRTRLLATAALVSNQRPKPQKAMMGRLEDWGRANPLLAALIIGLSGAVVGSIITRLLG